MYFDSTGGMYGDNYPTYGSNVIDTSGTVNEIEKNTVIETMGMAAAGKDFGDEGTKLPA